jgi:hypothetical protein
MDLLDKIEHVYILSLHIFLFDAIPKSRNVVFDFVDIVLGDALVLRLPLLLRHVAPDQIPHYGLQRRFKMSSFLTFKVLLSKEKKSRLMIKVKKNEKEP